MATRKSFAAVIVRPALVGFKDNVFCIQIGFEYRVPGMLTFAPLYGTFAFGLNEPHELALAHVAMREVLETVGVQSFHDLEEKQIRVRFGEHGSEQTVAIGAEDDSRWFDINEFAERLRCANPQVGRG